MIHSALHDARGGVAVVVVERVTTGRDLTGRVVDADRTLVLKALQDIAIGHKAAPTVPSPLPRLRDSASSCRRGGTNRPDAGSR